MMTFSLVTALFFFGVATSIGDAFTPLLTPEVPPPKQERRAFITNTASAAAMALAMPGVASAKLEGVNKPELLPKEEGKLVIQTENVLTSGQVKKLEEVLKRLEKDTGFRLRILSQRYPQTPGLAIREYWKLGPDAGGDDKFIVMVVDEFGGKGNPLNFNVGEGVKFALPNTYWTRLQGKFGSMFFVRDNGLDVAMLSGIDSIVNCLRSEDGFCVSP